MAKPIVNQPARDLTNWIDGVGSFYEYSRRTKQGKPYNEPAPYILERCYTPAARLYGNSTFGGLAQANAASGSFARPGPGYSEEYLVSETANAVNSARSKLLDKVKGSSALVAVNYVERQRSVDMIANRVNQMWRFTKALKSGDIYGAARQLNLSGAEIPPRLRPKARQRGGSSKSTPKKRAWRNSREFGNAFLEYHFGWEPLMRDIFTCVNLLSDPIPCTSFTVKGRSIAVDRERLWRGKPANHEYSIERVKGSVRASVSGEFSVTNPDLYLANRLGVVNPATVVWELVPFSFVIDWFINVNEFLDSFSDLTGLRVTKACYSTLARVTGYYEYFYKTHGRVITRTGLYYRRLLGFPSVTLGLLPLKRLSLTRAATAISLLLQQLKHDKAKSFI